MILLDGQPALSAFRLERLNARLAVVAPQARVRAASWLYLVEAAPQATLDRPLLAQILDAAAGPAADFGADELWVVPRLGTISPWS